MKKVLMFGIIIVALLSPTVTAHSPSSINITYTVESQELNVSINHFVSDPTTHYIYNITIEKNNVFYKSYEYTSQPSTSSFTYTYSGIVGEAGDMFSVVARCNQGGQNSKSLTIGSSAQDNGTPGFEFLVVVCALTVIMYWKRKRP